MSLAGMLIVFGVSIGWYVRRNDPQLDLRGMDGAGYTCGIAGGMGLPDPNGNVEKEAARSHYD